MASFQKVAFVLLVASCGAEALCKTKCGIEFEGKDAGVIPPGWNCNAIQAQEDKAVAAFASADIRSDAGDFKHACSLFNGYQLWLIADNPMALDAGVYAYWSEYDSGWVAGETACWFKWIQVVETPNPHYSALSHELAHVVQNCSDPYHNRWSDAGIYDAIEKADEQ